MIEFEYDLAKSQTNLTKHGIDFVDAQRLWLDENRLEISANFEDEPRNILIANAYAKIWFAVFTIRGERIRLISVRRARKKEVELYESQ